MSLSINWATSTITIPIADLSLVSSNVYTYDTSNFHTQVGLLQDSEQGITYDDIISYNSPYSVVGVTYAPKIELINGFKVQFEDGLYSVTLTGSNNNLFDIGSGKLVRNNVQVIPTNSAGLQTVATGSGVTSQDVTAIANAVDNILLDDFANVSATVDNNAIALAVETQLADDFSLVNTNIANIPTTDLTPVRGDIAALNDFNPSTQKVANVGTVDVTTLNTDMRGTDNANTLPPIAATAIRDAVWSATIRTTTDSNNVNIISVNGVNVASIDEFKSTPTVVDNNAIAASVDSILLDNFNALDTAIAAIPTVDMTKINLIAEILGLDSANPVTISESSYSSTNTNVTITDNGNGSYTLTKT